MADKPAPVPTMELTTRPERNLEVALTYALPRIMEVAAPNVKADEAWLMRTKMELLASEAVSLLTSQKGIDTAIRCIVKAATNGISFGALKPQAYFVPRDGAVCLDVSRHGRAAVSVYGPGAVLSVIPELIEVFQNDGTRMDQATGQIIFPKGGIDPFGERGALKGWMMRCEFKDGRQARVTYVSLADVEWILEHYGIQGNPARKKSPKEMMEKTAVKKLLDDAYSEATGRAQRAVDDLDDWDDEPPVINRDPASRMSDRLTRASSGMKRAEPTMPTVAEAGDPELEDDPEPKAGDAAEGGPEAEKSPAPGNEKGTEELF